MSPNKFPQILVLNYELMEKKGDFTQQVDRYGEVEDLISRSNTEVARLRLEYRNLASRELYEQAHHVHDKLKRLEELVVEMQTLSIYTFEAPQREEAKKQKA